MMEGKVIQIISASNTLVALTDAGYLYERAYISDYWIPINLKTKQGY